MAGKCAKIIMYLVNTLLLLLGIAVLGVSVAAKINRSAVVEKFPEYADAVPSTNITLAMAGGALIFVVAMVGLIGVCKYDSCGGKLFLTVYVLFLFLTLVLEAVAVGTIFFLAGRLDDFADKSPEAYDSFQTKVGQFTNTTFKRCCVNNTVALNVEGCSLLDRFVNEGNCANPKAFQRGFVDYVKSNLMMVAAFTITLAFVQLVTMYAACCLCCSRGEKAPAEQTAENMAYHKQQAANQPAAGAAISYA